MINKFFHILVLLAIPFFADADVMYWKISPETRIVGFSDPNKNAYTFANFDRMNRIIATDREGIVLKSSENDGENELLAEYFFESYVLDGKANPYDLIAGYGFDVKTDISEILRQLPDTFISVPLY